MKAVADLYRSVYLISDVDHGLYKIGVAKNPERRLKQLQTGNGNRLEILSTYKTIYAGAIEKLMHTRYKHLRTSGEWFMLSNDIAEAFVAVCTEMQAICEVMQDNPFNKFKPDNIWR